MRFDSSPRPRGAHIPQEIAVNVPSSRGEGRREKKKLVIVDNSEALDAIARDVAEENMTASKADLKGIKGFATKIWKHSLWHEYFRQKEIAKAKKDIEDSGSLYGAGREDAHKRAMDALINRFSSEYEESLHEGEERTKENVVSPVYTEIKNLIREYVNGTLDDDAFLQEKIRILSEVTNLDAGSVLGGLRHTDNLLQIAKQLKSSVAHGEGLSQLDEDFEVVIGKAKSGVRTEAQYNAVERIASKIQSTRVGKFFDEGTIVSGVAIAYSVSMGLGKRAVQSKAAAVLSFGGTALIAGGAMALQEGRRLEEERRQHFRDMAKGKSFDQTISPRRAEMEKFRYESVGAAARTLVLREGADRQTITPEMFRAQLSALADTEARIKISDHNRIDLLAYSDETLVDEERFNLDIARAEAKVNLRRLAATGGLLPPGISFDQHVQNLVGAQMRSLTEGGAGIEAKNRLFSKMKGRAMIKRGLIGVGVGIVGGAIVGEGVAFLRDEQQGLIESAIHGRSKIGSVTALEGLHRWISGEEIQGVTGAPHKVITTQPMSGTASQLVTDKPGLFKGVHRTLWYDNNTGAPVFDKNELGLHWGGKAGTGITPDGKYVFNIQSMISSGSYHGTLSVDAQKAIAAGKLQMLFSLSKGTQAFAVDIPIDAQGNAIIDPNSETGKLFFKTVNGKAVFLGKYAEVAEVMGAHPQGGANYRILATHVGKGQDTVAWDHTVTREVTPDATRSDLLPIDMPPFIPVLGRRPLEPTIKGDPVLPRSLRAIPGEGPTREGLIPMGGGYGYSSEGAGYAGEGFGILNRADYRERASKRILENKDIDLSGDDSEIVSEYLDKQDPKYIAELQSMLGHTRPMSKNIETVITIPAYREGKNLEKTLRNYAKQTNRGTFEIVILENHSRGITRDDTREVIDRVHREIPDLNIVHLYKVFDEKPVIGEVRKYLVDAVLMRKRDAGITRSMGIVSNDADLEDINPKYVDHISTTFRRDTKVDAVGAKWDYPMRDFEKFPLLHASQRLWQYLDIALRNYLLKSPDLIGRNSAFRSGAYAAIGGYNKNATLAEDLEIGWMIKQARGHNPQSVKYLNSAWLVSNPRRAIVKMLSGGKLVEQYGDFHRNEEVREADVDRLLAEKKDFSQEAFAAEVQEIYSYYARFTKTEYMDKSFKRAMRFLGVEYRLADNKVEILNTTKLMEGLNHKKNTTS